MALRKETIHLGAPKVCPECKTKAKLTTLKGIEGYYVGSTCLCGIYTRETIYTDIHTAAQMLEDYLAGKIFEGLRTTKLQEML